MRASLRETAAFADIWRPGHDGQMSKSRVVGIAELKAHLSEYLEQVRGGAELVVKHRSKAIARILPLHASAPPERDAELDALVAEGLVLPPRIRKTASQIAKEVCATSRRAPRLAGPSLLDTLLEDREDRV